ncbi:MAG: hypothetical protein ACHQF0_01225 [Chitinophagales bacterium]
MKFFLQLSLFGALYCLPFFTLVNAQTPFTSSVSAINQPSSPRDFFDNDGVLSIKLSGNLRELINDRGENPKYHSLIFSYKADRTEVSFAVEARTRGHFRKEAGNCNYPPILLHFLKSDSLNASIFKGQTTLKLVMPCQGDEYVVREWMVYKMYELITPKSFRARLVRVELNDTKKKKSTSPFYGILLEEEEHMALRNQTVLLKRKMRPEQIDPGSFLTMAVFEYLIGNTDWSVQYLQNIKLLATDSNSVPVTVPYDFDHAGVVNTPYAKPAEELEMSSVMERRYRGYCVPDMKKFDSVIALYNHLKTAFYQMYTGCELLDAKYIKTTISYFDEFYKTVNDPVSLQKEFSYPCDKNKTGNVVIKGMKND